MCKLEHTVYVQLEKSSWVYTVCTHYSDDETCTVQISGQVTFKYIALYTIQIVSKNLLQ